MAGPLTAGATRVKSVCTHCSVGCTVIAEVKNGVWVGQEPGWDSPFNMGSHCAKGASVREHAHNERRLKYPMKLVNGQWTRIKWDQAINEIGDKMLEIRKASGPDSVYWLGSAKFSNEQAYLFRKFYALLGLQQRRSPGAHLPFHHGRGRREYLGLWRDDQFLQRHAQFQGDDPVRLQSGRSASGRRAAHPARQGIEQVEADRVRSALHPNRRACRRVRALPSRHRRGAGVGHPLPHLQERLGRQGIRQTARLGPRPGQSGGHALDAGRDRESHRRSRRAARTRRQDAA